MMIVCRCWILEGVLFALLVDGALRRHAVMMLGDDVVQMTTMSPKNAAYMKVVVLSPFADNE